MFWKQKWKNKCRYLYLNGLNAFLVEYCSVRSTVFPEARGQVAKAPLNSVQFSRSVVSDSATPWTAPCQASLSITTSRSLPKLLSIESVMPSNHLILSSPSPPAPNPSQHQGLLNESALRIRWPKYWSFSFSISPSKEHPGLISFRMDLLNHLAVQGTLKSLFQHHSAKASIQQYEKAEHL